LALCLEGEPIKKISKNIFKKISLYLFGLSGLASFLISIFYFFDFIAEDAYIVARYAENLIKHGEFVFNLGNPVCAFTSPFHALLESILYLFFGSSIHAYRILAVFFIIVSTLLLIVKYRDRASALIFIVGILFSQSVLLWTACGSGRPCGFYNSGRYVPLRQCSNSYPGCRKKDII